MNIRAQGNISFDPRSHRGQTCYTQGGIELAVICGRDQDSGTLKPSAAAAAAHQIRRGENKYCRSTEHEIRLAFGSLR